MLTNQHRRHTLAVIALAGATVVMPVIARGWDTAGSRIRVVCTTTIIADLARQIAGEAADIQGIMKPGEDPHVYDVRPRDVQLIAQADLLLINGLHLEATLSHVIENNAGDTPVARLAEARGITPLQSDRFRGAPDPHCWFNVRHFRIYAEGVRDALIAADPKNTESYHARAAAYIEKLDGLHTWVAAQLQHVPRERRVMVTSHDAFQYLGQAYDVDVFAVIGISTEQQPRPRDIERLEALVRERGVRALFIETSVSQTLNTIVEKIARSTGAKIGGTLYSDSLGPPDSVAGTYLGMVRSNVEAIVEALR